MPLYHNCSLSIFVLPFPWRQGFLPAHFSSHEPLLVAAEPFLSRWIWRNDSPFVFEACLSIIAVACSIIQYSPCLFLDWFLPAHFPRASSCQLWLSLFCQNLLHNVSCYVRVYIHISIHIYYVYTCICIYIYISLFLQLSLFLWNKFAGNSWEKDVSLLPSEHVIKLARPRDRKHKRMEMHSGLRQNQTSPFSSISELPSGQETAFWARSRFFATGFFGTSLCLTLARSTTASVQAGPATPPVDSQLCTFRV